MTAAMRPAVKRPVVAAGAAIVAVYLAAVVAAMAGGATRVRPLYEGFSPPPRYSWVKPPPAFAAGNVVPEAQAQTTPLKSTGNQAAGITSPDAQVILNLNEGAIAAHAGDTGVLSNIVPVDAAQLGPAPAGLFADGNAYRIELNYQPSGLPVGPLQTAGDLILEVPVPGHRIVFSPDGRLWRVLATLQVGTPGSLGARFAEPGYYLGTSQQDPTKQATTAPPKGAAGSGGNSTLLVGLAVVVLAVIAFLVPVVRRRRQASSTARRPTTAGKASSRPGVGTRPGATPKKRRPLG